MRIKGFRAIYGDLNGAHQLIRSSPEIAAEAESLTHSTDNAHLRPENFAPKPFLRGWPVGGYYAFIKTFPDKAASRDGMVLSEALFFPLAGIVQVADLKPILSSFSPGPAEGKAAAISSFELDISSSDEPVVEGPGCRETLKLLIKNAEGPAVVWVGDDDFQAIVRFLWRHIGSALRETLRFRFSFVPQEFEKFPPTLIYVPNETARRWVDHPRVGAQFPLDSKESPAVSFLLNEEAGASIKELFGDLEVTVITWKNLRFAEECVDYLTKMGGGNISPGEFRGLMSRIGILSPDPSLGISFKKRLIEQFCVHRLENGTYSDLYGLNTFRFEPFNSVSKPLSHYASNWLERNLWELDHAQMSELYQKSLDGSAKGSPWGTAVIDGLKRSVVPATRNQAGKIWSWLVKARTLVELLSAAKLSAVALSLLSETCPKSIPAEVGSPMRAFAIKNRHWILHAAVAQAEMSSTGAIAVQLSVEPPDAADGESGIPQLLSKTSLTDSMSAVLSTLDDRLIKQLASVQMGGSGRLEGIDLGEEGWQALVLGMLEYDASKFWTKIPDPTTFVYQLFDLLQSGTLYRLKLIDLVADSEYADLSQYEKEASVWQHLRGENLDKFLKASASGWWRNFDSVKNPIGDGALEDVVYNEDHIAARIAAGSSPVSELQRIIGILPKLSQFDFTRFLRFAFDREPRIKRVSAVLLGKLVQEKSWYSAAKAILEYVDRGRSDLIPALDECSRLFGFIEKCLNPTLWDLSRGSITFEDWWKEFMNFLADHYPGGPIESHIWKKAGGHESDIVRGVPGSEAWDDAIEKLKKGKAKGKIDTAKIIDAIKVDLSKNTLIIQIEELFYLLGGQRFGD